MTTTRDPAGRIELAADCLAAAALAVAVGFASAAFGAVPFYPQAALAGVLGFAGLRRIGVPQTGLALPSFAAPPLDLPDELLLTERAAEEEPLLLDDRLGDIGPDSRVIQLFAPQPLLTPGELKARIDRHLDGSVARPDPPDAAQALHDALAELRRSLR